MKAEECTIGLEVYTDDGPLYRYIVTSLPDESGEVQVKPTKKSYGDMDSFHLDDLHVYNEEKLKQAAVKFQAKIDAAKSAFEAAFETLRQVNELDENNEEGCSRYSLEELGLVSVRELEHTIDSSGWSSSSLWC